MTDSQVLEFGEKVLAEIIEPAKESKLSVFGKLGTQGTREASEKKMKEEEALYRFKLDFPKISYSGVDLDMELCVFK
jgi:hypothetical protein